MLLQHYDTNHDLGHSYNRANLGARADYVPEPRSNSNSERGSHDGTDAASWVNRDALAEHIRTQHELRRERLDLTSVRRYEEPWNTEGLPRDWQRSETMASLGPAENILQEALRDCPEVHYPQDFFWDVDMACRQAT